MPSLPADTHEVAVAVREPKRPARAVVEIVGVELFEIRRREVVEHLQCFRREAQQRLPPQTLAADSTRHRRSARRANRAPTQDLRGSTRRSDARCS